MQKLSMLLAPCHLKIQHSVLKDSKWYTAINWAKGLVIIHHLALLEHIISETRSVSILRWGGDMGILFSLSHQKEMALSLDLR